MAHTVVYHETLKDDRLRLLQLDLTDVETNAVETTPLSLLLSTYSLADRPKYTCVSYAWHEPLAARGRCENSILVNGIEFPVQANLLHGLRVHLAKVREHRVPWDSAPRFWVDAICINQDNIPERDAQVAIMHRIYREASDVIVWLGPDPDCEAYLIREFFRALLKQHWMRDRQPNYKEKFLQWRGTTCLPEFGLPALEEVIWKATVRFWDRAWFRRTWVQQEVALAQATRFWCGDVEFTQIELERFSEFLLDSGMGGFLLLVRRGVGHDHEFAGAAVGGGAARFSATQRLMRGELKYGRIAALSAIEFDLGADKNCRTEGVHDRRFLDIWTGPGSGNENYMTRPSLVRSFAGLLFVSFVYDASDRRDKVFAPLVLINQLSITYGLEKPSLKADYAKSAAEVYRDTTAWLINSSGWLGAFNWISPKRSVSSQLRIGMPSWVVDFGSSGASEGVPVLQDQPDAPMSKAKRFLTSETRPSTTDSVLNVSVQRIGAVEEYGDHWDDMTFHGRLEKVAALLLSYPPIASNSGRTRLDAWASAWIGSTSTLPQSASVRSRFGRWTRSRLSVRLSQANDGGGFLKAFESTKSELRDVLQLAEEDESGILPTEHELRERIAGRLQSHEGNANEAGPFDPGLHRLEHWGRRLIRLGSLGSPYCPSAKLLGIGPQTCEVGDEVCFVAGSMMPVVLRPVKANSSISDQSATLQAHFVGLASVADAIEPSSGQWIRLEVV